MTMVGGGLLVNWLINNCNNAKKWYSSETIS